ncbi:JMJD7-like protein [Mya arenaria]|uniref:JMJD7-like protein n=2 Tax=Mya arenaria TaxID=6604 RepID=A0ABY7E285_MYAAR|nr:JMJD7-like protein [Mya arenaria]
MDAPRLLFVNLTVLLILMHFGVISLCHASVSRTSFEENMLTPTDVLQLSKQFCIVTLARTQAESGSPELQELEPEQEFLFQMFIELGQAYQTDSNVVLGFISLETFVWPSGNHLRFVDSDVQTTDLQDVNLVIFPRQVQDRTCLSNTGMNTKEPKAELYRGLSNVNVIVEYVNTKCGSYQKANGGITIEGLHRKEILSTLYYVGHHDEEALDMKTLHSKNVKTSHNQNCDKETCSIEHSKGNLFSKGFSRYTNQNDIFKNFDLGMAKCDRINMPTKEEFFHSYLKSSKPVVIKNALHEWPAMKKWTNEYFMKNYGNQKVHIKLTPLGEFEGVDLASNFENYGHFEIPQYITDQLLFPDLVVVRPATRNMKFSEFLELVSTVANGTKKNCSAYLEYSSISDIKADLENDIVELPLLKDMLALKHLNIWLSDGDTLGKLHFDPFDNFLCQISGRKQVILFEPHDNRRLYEAHIPEAVLGYDSDTNTFRKEALVDSTSMVMSPVDITNPDFERFPLFETVRPLNCTIDEGDVLFMPAFWWHEVQSFPSQQQRRNLAVNFWYDPFLVKEFPCQECQLDINSKYRHLL